MKQKKDYMPTAHKQHKHDTYIKEFANNAARTQQTLQQKYITYK